jgi:hypothetical protein
MDLKIFHSKTEKQSPAKHFCAYKPHELLASLYHLVTKDYYQTELVPDEKHFKWNYLESVADNFRYVKFRGLALRGNQWAEGSVTICMSTQQKLEVAHEGNDNGI